MKWELHGENARQTQRGADSKATAVGRIWQEHCDAVWASPLQASLSSQHPSPPCSLWASSKLLEMLRVINCLDHVGSKNQEGKWRLREWCSESQGSSLWFGVSSTLERNNSMEPVTWITWSSMSETRGEAVVSTVGDPVHCSLLWQGWAHRWSPLVLWSVLCYFDVLFFLAALMICLLWHMFAEFIHYHNHFLEEMVWLPVFLSLFFFFNWGHHGYISSKLRLSHANS